MKLIHRRCPIIRSAFVFVSMPPSCYAMYIPVNTNHLYNICTMLDQRRRCWADIVQMLYKCFVFAGNVLRWNNLAFLFFISQTSFINQFFTWSMSNICSNAYFIYLKSDWMYCFPLLHVIAYTFRITMHASWHLYARAKPKDSIHLHCSLALQSSMWVCDFQHYPVPRRAMKSQ